jgi:hypothetical protein
VLIHVDTEQAAEKLVNRRLAYVAVSRGRYDAQIYTSDKTRLADQLSQEVSHSSALEVSRLQQPAPVTQGIGQAAAQGPAKAVGGLAQAIGR